MKIKFSPIRSDSKLEASLKGDCLILNGVSYDFTPLLDGATLPAEAIECAHIVGDVFRENGHVVITLLLPHGPNAPQETRFPVDIVTTKDGVVTLPPYGEDNA